jgi:hypothetical protein
MPFDLENLLYRGDSREPGLVFPFGFARRMNSWKYFENKWKEYLDGQFEKKQQSSYLANKSGVPKIKGEDNYEFRAAFGFTPLRGSKIHYPNFGYKNTDRSHTLTFQDSQGKTKTVDLKVDQSPAELWAEWLKESRLIKMRAQGDLDLESGVCETPNITVAALFPIPKVYPPNGRDETWIYVVYNDESPGLFKTYKQQKALSATSKVAASLARSKEVASYDIPSGYVLAAVKCSRHWTLSKELRGKVKVRKELVPNIKPDWRHGVSFTLQGPVVINPKLANQTDLVGRLIDRMHEALTPLKMKCMEFKELSDKQVFG